MAVDRSWSPAYLQKQKEAIGWLLELGLTPEEIRVLRWGCVDDLDKVFIFCTEVTYLKANLDTGEIQREECYKELKISLRGTRCEGFFLKSKIPCPWMFTRERPKTWRREGSKESLYSLSEIKAICRKFNSVYPCKKLSLNSINLLTNPDNFANIEVSKLNITKSKTKELEGKT